MKKKIYINNDNANDNCILYSVLSVLLVLVWIKLEIIGERIYQQFEYQKLINTETTKELTELIKEVKELKVRRDTFNISPITIRRNIPSYCRDLNSEEILFNSLLNENEITEDIYKDLENNSDEELQELSYGRNKL